MSLYVDGNLVDTVDVSDGVNDNYNTSNVLGIGAYQNSDGTVFDRAWFKGQIDDVRIYNRALSEDEVKYLYETTYRE
jgi:hypothetical protein